MDEVLNWVKIAANRQEIILHNNRIGIVELNGKKICIGEQGASLVAFAFKCPHAGGILADGYFDGQGNIVCPIHRYKFNPVNGRNCSGEGYYLKTWPVDIRQDGVYIGTKPGFWDSLLKKM